MNRGAAFGLLLLPLAAWTCRVQPPAEARPAPTASVTALAPAASAPAGAQASARTRSSPGQILCGNARCDLATEVCCATLAGEAQRCAARPKNPSQDPCGGQLSMSCDGAEDCPGGACCETANCTGDCPPMHACEAPRCESGPGGVCIPGGACPDGFVCSLAASDKSAERGACVQKSPGVTCGATRCRGATPLCCWNTQSKSGTCATSCPGDGMGDVGSLSCGNNADCAGYVCGRFSSSPAQIFSCAGHSFAGDRFDPILCAATSECPKHFGRAAIGCEPVVDGSLPPNIRVCRYEEE